MIAPTIPVGVGEAVSEGEGEAVGVGWLALDGGEGVTGAYPPNPVSIWLLLHSLEPAPSRTSWLTRTHLLSTLSRCERVTR